MSNETRLSPLLATALLVAFALLPACSASPEPPRGGTGGGGGTGGDDAAADAGAFTVDDSGAPSFTIADAATMGFGDCVAGDYKGTFEGVITVLNFVPLGIQGSVNMTLSSMMTGSGEFKSLEISNGHVKGADTNGNSYEADLLGSLNCTSKMLEGGALKNGIYNFSIFPGAAPTVYHFEGPLTATYTSPPATLTGTWGPVMESTGLATAQGKWTASHM